MARIPSPAGRSNPRPADARRAAIQRAREERPERPRYRTRRIRETERSRAALLAAVPADCRPAVHVMEWMRAAKAHPLIDGLRRDARARMHALIEHIARRETNTANVCTLVVLRAAAAEALHVTERSVTTYFTLLRDAGLLCTVAAARSAEYQPKNSPHKGQNDAAIHGLTIPLTPAEALARATPDTTETPTETQAVEETFSPNPVGLEKDHVRTREDEFSERSRFAAQEMNRRRASRSAWHTCRAQRKAPLWSRHATVAQDEGGHLTRQAVRTRLHEMAMTLQEHAPDTRDVSTAHVASIIRPFVLAGWSVADVQHALDWTPDGTRHWQAAQGMGRIDAWMRARLAHWTREDNTPARSFTQERRDHEAQVRAQIAADRARAAEARRTAARTIPAEARAALDAIRAANAERRAAERHHRAVPVLS